MNIPQEELDKLNNVSVEDVFPEEIQEEDQQEETEQPEEQVKEEVSVSPDEDTVADEARIPYSRFEKVNERALRAEERLKILEEQMTAKTETKSNELEMPEEWIELYGNSDAAKRAYELQLKREEKLQEQLIERIEAQKKQEEETIKNNISYIDQQLTEFQGKLGRKLSETEENAILDIQDEFTQKDANGNYLTQLLSPEKAYEIYSLRQEKTIMAKKQAKNRVLSVTGAGSESEVDTTSNADFNPSAWGSWRDRI
jgi:hypothetical protein